MIKLEIQYLEDEEIAKHADGFLQKYHKSKSTPVPIEEIIDLDFNIDIIPLPGVQDLCDVEGFISPDFKAIYVDKYVYDNRPYRFRFTLAHEIGHLIIHKEKLSQIEKTKNIPIIFMTAYNTAEINAQALEIGAKECMSKPFTGDNIENTVRMYI